jgi:hypothetical protein
MATTSPARIDDELYASAKLAGEVQSRSASQQVAHWARIGRELEASASISVRAVAEALVGSRSYDDLDAEEQALVRAEWAERMSAYREGLDLIQRFGEQGRHSWVELDDDGRVVERSLSDSGAAPPVTRRRSSSEAAGSRPADQSTAASKRAVGAKTPKAGSVKGTQRRTSAPRTGESRSAPSKESARAPTSKAGSVKGAERPLA